MSQALVLDNGGVAHALVFAKDAIGKRVAFPSHLERSICEVIDLDVLNRQAIDQLTSFQDDLSAVAGQAELLADVTLLSVAQDVGSRDACTFSVR
jgi:hypothetical protein